MSSGSENMELAMNGQLPVDLFALSAVAISIIREDGLVVFINATARKLYAPVGGERVREGVRDFADYPHEFAASRIAFLRQLAIAGKDGISRDILAGEQVLAHLHLLPAHPESSLRHFFVISHRLQGEVTTASFPDAVFNDSKAQDLGGLSVLSPRELEVLSLVGQGLPAASIAERIHRSLETVNTHKASILRKLDCHNAVQLSIIANRAGLKFSDGSHLAG